MNFFENTRKPQGFGGKLMINGELVIEWKKEKMHKGCSCGEYLL